MRVPRCLSLLVILLVSSWVIAQQPETSTPTTTPADQPSGQQSGGYSGQRSTTSPADQQNTSGQGTSGQSTASQSPVENQTGTEKQDSSQVEPMAQTPVYRITVVSRTTKAVNYRHRGGSTRVDFRGTDLMPQVTGSAKVDSKAGRLEINAGFDHLQPARNFGPEYLTYVLWAITPEGRPSNLGELVPGDGGVKIHVTTGLQSFGMIVTAEPYFAVTQPSNLIVAENVVRPDTAGWEQPIDTKFDLLERGAYTIDVPAAQLPATSAPPNTPLELMEAMNAVAIAKAAKADQYAPDALQKAQDFLAKAQDYLTRNQGRTPIGTVARGATESAEDARVLTIRKREQERLDAERRSMQEQTTQAQSEAQQSAAQAQQAAQERQKAEEARAQAEQQAQNATTEAEQQRQAAEQAKADALAQQQQAQAANQQAEQQRQEAEAARQAAQAQQQAAQAEIQRANLAAQQAQQEKEQMRTRLLQQLNQVLQTRDSARGLIVNMSDVLFDFGKSTLRAGARERLAKVAGIVLAYPDLRLQIEGHTDNVGSDRYNQQLSERRAGVVKDYLVAQGVNINNVTAQGLGKTQPVASNATATGRQLNRRVELIVSGEAIGNQVGAMNPAGGAPNTAVPGGQIPGSQAAVPSQTGTAQQGNSSVGQSGSSQPENGPAPQSTPPSMPQSGSQTPPQ